MGKRVVSIAKSQKRETALSHLNKELGGEFACYVLITCTQPDAQGKMEVSLDFEGDETLASFLVENAAQVFEDRDVSRKTK